MSCKLCDQGLPVVFYSGWPYHEDPETTFHGRIIYWNCQLSVDAARQKETQQIRNALIKGVPSVRGK